jgi:long-chain-alcohol oxidase
LARVDRADYGPNRTLYPSFRQVGAYRIGSRRHLDAERRGRDACRAGLTVAQSSSFPSASGVNPLLTVAALAHYVAQQIKTRF